MTHRAIALHAALVAAGFIAHSAALAQTPERGCVELKTVAEIEQAYVDERGQPAKRLVPAAKVLPGDEVVWTIVASNVCATAAGDVAITNPVPTHMHYVGDSAFGPKNIITAVAQGHEAAISIDRYCRGEDPRVRPAGEASPCASKR